MLCSNNATFFDMIFILVGVNVPTSEEFALIHSFD